jgi:ribosome-binding protein aMBF1 (putative translation factor)
VVRATPSGQGKRTGPDRIDVDVDRAISLYREGAAFNRIAALVGCSPSTLKVRLREAGIVRNRPPGRQFNAADVDKAVALFHQNVPYVRIAATLGWGANTVKKRLAERGLRRDNPAMRPSQRHAAAPAPQQPPARVVDPASIDPAQHHADDAALRHLVVGQLVRAREGRGLTQAVLARRMGVSQSTVCEFEAERGDPRLSTFRRYARAVGLDLLVQVSESPQTTHIGRKKTL